MKNVFVLIGICLAVAMMVSPNLSSAEETKSTASPEWKHYPLKLVKNQKPGIKAITPSTIHGYKDAFPSVILTYTTGKVEGVEIALIDDNKNGAYNDVGTDVMIIDNYAYGVPLSTVINIKNKLYYFEVDDLTGEKVSIKPYEDECGMVDMVSEFKCDYPLDLVILNCGQDKYYDVVREKKTKLPCGTYNLWLGFVNEGANNVAIKQGQMENIVVTNEKKVNAIKWGSPFVLNFQCTADSKEVKATYRDIKVSGKAKEVYYNFNPVVVPDVVITDAKKEPVTKGSFCKS
ncbi:MAG: hypothetical protein V1701_09505 [Planctomycetota bacterium]